MCNEFKINDYVLNLEAKSIAQEAFNESTEYNNGDEDSMLEHVQQSCDGHEWVIYYYKAMKLVTECNTDRGDQFLEDTGMPADVTIHKLATIVAYGELDGRAQEALAELIAA